MAYSYPILLDLSGKLVVIVGGGQLAVRKARGLIEGGATRIRSVAPEIDAGMPSEVETIIATFRPSHIDGAALVFAATDSAQVNSEVVEAAHHRQILVSRPGSEGESGDFIVPANWRNGRVIVSVSTGDPALSATLRDDIKSSVGSIKSYERLADLAVTLRRWVLNSSLDKIHQVAALYKIASKEGLTVLEEQGEDGLRQWLMEQYPELKRGAP